MRLFRTSCLCVSAAFLLAWLVTSLTWLGLGPTTFVWRDARWNMATGSGQVLFMWQRPFDALRERGVIKGFGIPGFGCSYYYNVRARREDGTPCTSKQISFIISYLWLAVLTGSLPAWRIYAERRRRARGFEVVVPTSISSAQR